MRSVLSDLFVFALILLLGLSLGGCRASRTVVVERPAPPASVVVRSDTVRVVSPPDTAYVVVARRDTVTLPGRVVEREVVRTVPRVVTVYREPRPDSAFVFGLHALVVDSSVVRLMGYRSDFEYARPVPGETLVVEGRGRDSLAASVVGEPVVPPAETIECPACPRCLVTRSFWGYVRLTWIVAVVLLLGIAGGFFAGRFSRLGPLSLSSR